MNAIAAMNDYKATDRIIKASKELFDATIKGDEKAVAMALDESHIHVIGEKEKILQCRIERFEI